MYGNTAIVGGEYDYSNEPPEIVELLGFLIARTLSSIFRYKPD